MPVSHVNGYVYIGRIAEDNYIQILTSSGVLEFANKNLAAFTHEFRGWKPGPCSNATELFTKLANNNLEWWRLVDSDLIKLGDLGRLDRLLSLIPR
jgi:hypothetical protein